MPSEGDTEKYAKMLKSTGFMAKNILRAMDGKVIDNTEKNKPALDPGTLVTPQQIN